MKRILALAGAAFAAHLVEEALTGMDRDPLIVAAWARLEPLGARHAAYLVFQATLALGLAAVVLFAAGGRARRLVVLAFAIALLAEGHHAIRAIYTHQGNSGLFTSLPLPVLGGLVLRGLRSCSTTSSSPWESVASSSGSRPSSPRGPRRVSSGFPPTTTARPRV